MKLRIDEIKDQPKLLMFEEKAEVFPVLQELSDSDECEFLGPITVELSVWREYDHIRVRGSVATAVRLNCSRCLTPFESHIRSAFTMIYMERKQELQDEDEVELGEEDLVSVTYVGDEIDFTPEVAEQVVMELPLKPLCRVDCLGLCTRCGADLNVGECGCERGSFNIKFAALKNLKVEK
ncbi:YceD family protein [Geobacter pickeringii]|uniref:DUF177 domain-containing protein n=1 Tax=Geobacter pickeringii TaxID=345632 RepID=A0A0B5BGW4_9BACT|nr:DUF177 domain-containing protein [Geobacter pickeringii]AJE03286.1 hypothetical protein GPICK_07915 [Geobacter pickeringii]